MSNEHVHPTFKEILHTASGIANKAMPTESDLQERIDALEAEIAALRESMDARDAAVRERTMRGSRIVSLGQCRANSELHEMRVECIDWKCVKNATIADGVQGKPETPTQPSAEGSIR